ncbi:MAG: hypothetical protein AAF974_02705 [Cyanobacteria bacterium P01_E01_bin.34]
MFSISFTAKVQWLVVVAWLAFFVRATSPPQDRSLCRLCLVLLVPYHSLEVDCIVAAFSGLGLELKSSGWSLEIVCNGVGYGGPLRWSV